MPPTRAFLVVVEVVGTDADVRRLLHAIADADLPTAQEITSWAIPDDLERRIRSIVEAI